MGSIIQAIKSGLYLTLDPCMSTSRYDLRRSLSQLLAGPCHLIAPHSHRSYGLNWSVYPFVRSSTLVTDAGSPDSAASVSDDRVFYCFQRIQAYEHTC
jgi:hypothetical protein